MTPDQALAMLGLTNRATADEISQAIAREYRLWQSRTNAPDFEAQTFARRRVKELGEAEIILLGDRRTRSHQPSPTPAPATSGAPRGQAPAPYGQAPPPYGQQPSDRTWEPPPGTRPQPEPAPRWTAPTTPEKPPVQVGDPIDVATRFGAKFLDLIAVGIVTSVGIAMLEAVGAWPAYGFASSYLDAAAWVSLAIGYFVVFESQWGRSLGKMAMKIEVTDPYGKLPSLERALKRHAWIGLALIPVVGWLVLAVAAVAIAVSIQHSPTKQGWHDEFARGTRVIKAA